MPKPFKRVPGPASRRDFLLVATASAAIIPTALPEAAIGQGVARDNASLVPQDFGAVGDGSRDDSHAMQQALNRSAATGRPLSVPPGRYRIDRPIVIRADGFLPYSSAFAPGPRIAGAGSGRTVFENRANAPLFDLDSLVDHRQGFKGVLGSYFEGFTISGGGGGIRLRTAYHSLIRDVHIIGARGTGVEIVCLAGDNDGSNMVSLERVRIENCRGWGIDSAAAAGFNEISFLRLQHVFIQGCGTPEAAGIPSSGGMRWKGQICTIDQCAFAINENVALFIPGEAGLAQSIDISGTAFENNHQKQILCTGISTFKARNIQFYNNDANTTVVACDFDATRNTVRFVDINGVAVRASKGNQGYTAFRLRGGNAEVDTCRVRNVVWDDFDYPGQARFQGFQFDSVRQDCELMATPEAVVFGPVGKGNKTPLRLRGGNGGVPSSTGEWVEASVLSPVVLAATKLAPDAHYNIYLYDNNNVKALEVSTVQPVLDPVSGYRVKNEDRSKLFVGRLKTGPAGQFIPGQAVTAH